MSSSSIPGNTTVPPQEANFPDKPKTDNADTLAFNTAVSQLQDGFGAVLNHLPGATGSEDYTGVAQNLARMAAQQNRDHKDQIEKIKTLVREDFPKEITAELGPEIQNHINAEIQALARGEFDAQFHNLVQISIEKQLEETTEQLRLAQNACINSEARRMNSHLDLAISECLTDNLMVVLKPNGMRSSWWPADLNSLFAYDSETVKKLLKDYDIPLDKTLETNLNQFMAHIGIRQQLVQ